MKRLLALFSLSLITLNTYSAEYILGKPLDLRLAVVEFSQSEATLIDVDSLRVKDGVITLQRHVRHYGENDSRNGTAFLTSETFNCLQNTIQQNSFYIYTYLNEDLVFKDNPMNKPQTKQSDNLSNKLCDGVLDKPSDISDSSYTNMLRIAFLNSNEQYITSLPSGAFSIRELFNLTFDANGKVTKAEPTEMLSYIQEQNKSHN
jgi:hypothetical protein